MKKNVYIEEVIEQKRITDKKKSGVLAYWSKVDNQFLVNYVNISFLKKDRRETLNIVRETESSNTFLFWADSPEGEKFYNDNYNKIASAIKEQQVKPWLNYEYRIEKK
jgi:hypothetical protein